MVSPELLITSESMGLVKGQTLKDVKLLLPKAVVSIEKGTEDKLRGGESYYFVFKQDGVELFRSLCWCNLRQAGRIGLKGYGTDYQSIDEVHVVPIATNSQYRTDRGIHVGSTVRELKDAYKDMGKLFLISEESSYGEKKYPSIEYACIRSSAKNKSTRPEKMETVLFYVTPSNGKKTVGTYKKRFDRAAIAIDLNARIYAIAVIADCNPYLETGQI
jgi:hypothetical protein